MTWIYEGKEFDPSEDDLKEYVGFVYQITDTETGMKYIGKKLFWRPKVLPVNSKRKRRKHLKVQSDWRDYFSSSALLQESVKEKGIDNFKREIFQLCRTKGECSYYEAKTQFDKDVLLREDYYNGIINCRINAKHLPHIRLDE
jgi:hypothetical protein